MKAKKKILLVVCSILFSVVIVFAADFPYRSYAPIITSPSEDVTCMMFDSEGMLWVGTNSGVKSYDGYAFKTYRADAYTPGILPNNTIRSITEDKEGGLWLGTRNGLTRMDKRTGEFKTFFLPHEDQRTIYTLYTSRDGTVWIGTDGGLSRYDPKTKKFYNYEETKTWVTDADGRKSIIGDYSVKAILEDTNGDILIGTWNSGLMRLRRGAKSFLRYPRINEKNSAYSLFFDSRHRLWVGSWGNGILRIDNPNDVKHPKIHQYPYATRAYDIFYKVLEDKSTGTLWACTREGICSLNINNVDGDWTKYTSIGGKPMSFCNGMAQDRSGNLWICTQNSGIIQTTNKASLFTQYNLTDKPDGMPVNYVWCILTTDGNKFWLGMNPYGIALYDKQNGSTLYNKSIPGFASLPSDVFTTSVSGIARRSNGEIWIATNSYGIVVYNNGEAHIIDRASIPRLWDNYVNTISSSDDGTMWVGSRNGLNKVDKYGNWKRIILNEGKDDLSKCDIRHITLSKDGLWLATDNRGIIHLVKDKKDKLRFHAYNPTKDNFAVDDATACLVDKYGRIWAISNSGGLFLYNARHDRFDAKNRDLHIPGNRVIAINEDNAGNLWLTTDRGLVEVTVANGKDKNNVRVFTGDDGLENVLFSTNSTFSFGNKLYFGNRTGFFSFTSNTADKTDASSPFPLVITDFLIDDTPFTLVDSSLQRRISDCMPSYANKMTIPASIRKFTVDFSLLTYGNAEKNMYAYKLEGYDDDWHYINNRHSATFQNLPSGSYKLLVSATDGDGIQTELPYPLRIKVLPPWFASWWAYIIYILLIAAAIFLSIRWYKERLRTQNRLRTGILLTNITHELMTPLTVVAATIHKLRNLTPQYDDDYQVIDNNLSRTTRLLRQILEVRKSQAGQLRLKVSRQDIVAFVSNISEAIRPMAEGKGLSLDIIVPGEEVPAWFDKDKLDKILYNLISNAIKYNKEDGRVAVSLSTSKDDVTIKVHDTGIGMTKDQLKHLYTRFFDGDYRKQNIQGTGIGLALVHELVKLHHGSIDCESKVDEGTTFTVTLPIRKGAYSKDEIDTSTVSSAVDRETMAQIKDEGNDAKVKTQSVFVLSKAPAVLIVEDNDDLRELMRQTLSKKYRILTAKNGKQAWNIIQKEKLDLVITDVMMPVMDGIELLHTIKNDKGYWQLPVMLLTAKAQDEDKKEGYAAGADAYIVKPFDFDELMVRADSLLVNRRKIMEQQEEKKELEVKPEAHVHASNPDQVFLDKAKACVMEHIDNPDFDRESFAKEMLVSSSTLYNKVRALTGKTIVEFVNDIRLEEAYHIQKAEPNITIAELSSRVGFNTPKYFSKLYRKKYKSGD